MAAWQDLKRRRCAINQLSKCGLRSSLQPVEEVADEQFGQSLQALDIKRPNTFRRGRGDGARIDENVIQIKSDRVARGLDPWAIGFVEYAAQLAEAPAKLAPGIVGHIPQQLAQAAAPDRMRSQRQIGKQRAQLPRGRKRDRGASASNRQRSEQAHGKAGSLAVQARSSGFHGAFPRLLPRLPVGLLLYHLNRQDASGCDFPRRMPPLPLCRQVEEPSAARSRNLAAQTAGL